MTFSLQGKKILVTREQYESNVFAALIRREKGIPLVCPLLESTCAQNVTINNVNQYEWIFFTSAKGVKCFFLLAVRNLDLQNVRFAVIGPKTKAALQQLGYKADFMPTSYRAKDMVEQFFDVYPSVQRILLVQGNIALQTIEQACIERQTAYDCLIVYEKSHLTNQKEKLWELFKDHKIDMITLTCPSIARTYYSLIQDHPNHLEIKQIPTICIGPTTEQIAIDLGFLTTIIPDDYTVEGMLEKMKLYM